MKESKANDLNVTPLARIISWATVGVDPSVMGIGPVPAVKKALELASWRLDDLDLIEANEAFAAQSLGIGKELQWDLKSKCKWWCNCTRTSNRCIWYKNFSNINSRTY